LAIFVSGAAQAATTLIFSSQKLIPRPARKKKFLLNPNSEIEKGAGRTRPCRSAPVLGRSNWLHSSHGTFPDCLPIPLCCGRDGRTPLTQKFNFGVPVESINADSTGQNAFQPKTGLANK
jgi:hypothetical protein